MYPSESQKKKFLRKGAKDKALIKRRFTKVGDSYENKPRMVKHPETSAGLANGKALPPPAVKRPGEKIWMLLLSELTEPWS